MSRRTLYVEISRFAVGARLPWGQSNEVSDAGTGGHHPNIHQPWRMTDRQLRAAVCEGTDAELCGKCLGCEYGKEALRRYEEHGGVFRKRAV